MKLKPDYVLREVAGSWVVLPLGEKILNFNGMLSLNKTGVLLWKALEQGGNRAELANALTENYDVSFDQALSDVDDFLNKLIQIGCMDAE